MWEINMIIIHTGSDTESLLLVLLCNGRTWFKNVLNNLVHYWFGLQ